MTSKREVRTGAGIELEVTAMKITSKPGMPSLTKFVIFSFIMTIVFTIVVIVSAWWDHEISDTLITCFFAIFGGEVLTCALIKIFKLKEEKEDEEDDESEAEG